MERIRFRWNVFRQVTIAVVIVSFTGCSIFAPSMQTIQVSSSPDGATVVAGGQPVGETPVQFETHRLPVRGNTILKLMGSFWSRESSHQISILLSRIPQLS